MNHKTNVCVLASTSSGNCTVIWNDRVSILVDCGTGISYTEESLAGLGCSLRDISAAFITHSHSDHVNQYTLKRLMDLRVPVYCHAAVAKALRKFHPFLLEKNATFNAFSKSRGDLEGFSYISFCVPHDSRGGCYGYSFFLNQSGITK